MDKEGIDPKALEKSGADILHISPSHHFPTGIVTPIARRYTLLDWAAQSENRYIIEDDYDSEFRLTGKPIPALQSIDSADRVIYMNTFSKSLASTIRISYMVLPTALAEAFYKNLGFYACTVSNLEQYTLAKFISEGYFEKHINRMRIRYKQKKDLILKEMKRCGLLKLAKIDLCPFFLCNIIISCFIPAVCIFSCVSADLCPPKRSPAARRKTACASPGFRRITIQRP